MSQNAVKYLLEYKDKFSKEKLVSSLKRAGYREDQIITAINKVFPIAAKKPEGPAIKPKAKDFIDIRKPLVYRNWKDKTIDFIIGFLLPWVIGVILTLVLFGWGVLATLAIVIFLLGYLKNRRYYIYRGLKFSLIITVVLLLLAIIFFLLTFSRDFNLFF